MLRFDLSALLALASVLPLAAQSITGSITGTVKDPNGAVAPSAQVSATNVNTGVVRSAASSDAGAFAIANLDPGVYDLSVQLAGFKTYTRKSITLPAAERLVVGILTLEIGAVSESVTVVAQGASVQTESFERSGVITSSQVDSLLVKGRSIYSMIALLPGIQDEREEEQPGNVWQIRALGGRQRSNDISVDGVSIVNMSENYSSTVDVSMDSVAEVKVQTATFQAENGRMSGANVRIVSKSGTKEFHGLGSYFKRHEQFNATNFFNNRLSQPKPRYRFNTFNYNIGGPVMLPGTRFNRNRDKLFFFWSQEFWPTTQSTLSTLTVPSALERGGDFSQSLDVNGRVITVFDPTSRVALPGNRVPVSQVNASGAALLKMFPEPNFLDAAVSGRRYNYVTERPADRNYRTQTLKINYNHSPKHMLSANWSLRTDPRDGYYGQQIHSQNWPQMIVNEVNQGFGVIGRYNTIISPTFLNELNAGYTRQRRGTSAPEDSLRRNRRDVAGFAAGQIIAASNPLNLIPDATFAGISNPAALSIDGRFPADETNPQIQIADTVTRISGPHTFKAGFNWDYLYADETSSAAYHGTINFGTNVNNPLDTRHPYANAAFGVFNQYSEDTALPRYRTRIKRVEWFLQDTWKATGKLTLDYGARFHWLPYPYERDGLVSGFVPDRWDSRKAPVLMRPATVGGRRVARNPITGEGLPVVLIGAYAPGSGDPGNGMVSLAKDPAYGPGLVKNPPILFGPRFGFAYDLFGNGRTALRGGAGILYNRPWGYDATRFFNRQTPQIETQTLYYDSLNNLASAKGYAFPQTVRGQDRDGKTPTVYNFSLAVQHNIGKGTLVEAAYVGALSRHLQWSMQVNDVPLGANWRPENLDPTNSAVALAANFLRPLQGHADIGIWQWHATSNYHSLQAQAHRRFVRGLQFGLAWTWSRTEAPFGEDRENVTPLVPFRDYYWGLSAWDRTHMVKLNWVWELPKVPAAIGRNAALRYALNGWQVSGIDSFISGRPQAINWSSTTPVDITGSPSVTARVVTLEDAVLPRGERTFERNFRTEVFRMPQRAALGSSPKFPVRGPGINNWDIAFFKSFPIREPNMRVQFRWELYNAFNHSQFSAFDAGARFDPQGAQVNTQFGQFTAARNPRIMQASLRFYF